MRYRLLPTLAVATMAFALVGCAGGGGSDADGASNADCEVTASGSNSDQIEVAGGEGDAPEVSFPTPLTAETTERSVIDEGSGEQAVEGSSLTVDILGFNASSGDPIEALTAEATSIKIEEGLVPGLVSALSCSVAGDRVAAVIPPVDFASSGREQLGLEESDSIVLLIDVSEVAEPVEALERADGEDQPAPEGFPTVELADDGAPTITVPQTDPPAELQIADLKVGDGPEVADGDTVTVHYTGVVWATGAVFDSSWEGGEPASFPTGGVISGFSQALVGHTVGSQVIAVIPPADGYGEAGAGDQIGPTDTLVFVVDILATQ